MNDAQIENLRREIENSVNDDLGPDNTDKKEPVVNVRNLNQDDIDFMIEQVRNPGQIVEDDIENNDLHGEDLLDSLFFDENEAQILEARDDIIRMYSQTAASSFVDRDSLPKIPFTSKSNKKVQIFNFALRVILSDIGQDESLDISSLNDLLYATSKAATESIGVKINRKKKVPHSHQPPKWKWKIQKEVEALRVELSILDEISRGVNVRTRKSHRLKKKYNVENKTSLDSAKEKVKQIMQLKAQRLRRYDKRNKFYRQNKKFTTDAKKFYRELGKGSITVDNPPSEAEVEGFWNKIWGEEKSFNQDAPWIEREEQRMKDLEHQKIW